MDQLPTARYECSIELLILQFKGSMKELNKSHNNETEKITHKASEVAEYMELFGSSIQDRHARRI